MRRVSAPQDHYLLAWALSMGVGEWQPWAIGGNRFREPFGQFNLDGTPYVTRIGAMGIPIITAPLREAIIKKIEEWRLEE